MKACIGYYIKGYVGYAQRLAKKYTHEQLYQSLRMKYGKSMGKSVAIANYLKAI